MREMKDSGVEWLGEVPAGWEVDRLGSFFASRNQKVSDEDYPALSVTMGGVVPQLSHVAKSDDHANRKLVCEGDFVINSRSDRRNSCGFAYQDGSVSLINTICIPRKEMEPRYFGFLFDTSQWADEFYAWGHGIVSDLWTTGWNDMKKILLPVPPLDEQRRIANFLDEKCAQIDHAVFAAERSIQEYRAYSNSVVFQAVTKGLDPGTQMKDSGVEWLGEVPAGWGVVPLKRVAVLHHGSDPKLEGEVPVYGSGQSSFKTCGEYKNGPAVLLGRKGTLDCPQYIEGKFWNVDTAFDAAMRSENMTIKFFYYAICSYDPGVLSTNTVKPSMTQGAWYSVRLPFPPLDEQRRIAEFLDVKCAQVDRAVEAKQAIIDELKSYKKSLIYEVVTGKREV